VIKRALGEAGGQMEEVTYEGYAPGGIALMVACLTDNRHRTSPASSTSSTSAAGNLGGPVRRLPVPAALDVRLRRVGR